MPLYEYQCDDCGNRFERIQKFSDPPVDKCPRCGGVVRKLISSPAIQFKGSGWYITDYARKGESAGKSEGGGSTDAAGDRPASQETASANGPSKETSSSKEAVKETSASKEAPKESAGPAAGKATPGSKT
jgi:putative FmdB family regulatory protein